MIAALTQSGGAQGLAVVILAACVVVWVVEMRAQSRAERADRVRREFGRLDTERKR